MASHFAGSASASYTDRAPLQVPGYFDLHRMTTQLLSERMPPAGRVLVLGAGGGLELKAFAEARPAWTFDGIDPSAAMLELARQTLGALVDRVQLHEGYIDAAPEGPFDGATSLLTFHFVPREQRFETLRQIHRRLRPGAPFVLAHISFPQTEPERSTWIARHVAYGAADGTPHDQLATSRQAIGTKLAILAPEEEEALLREAGFDGVAQFYHALSFRGWVAYAV